MYQPQENSSLGYQVVAHFLVFVELIKLLEIKELSYLENKLTLPKNID